MSLRLEARVWLSPTASLRDVLAGEDLDWVDVSRWVRLSDGLRMSRGRTGGAASSVPAGVVSLTADNPGGVWTRGGDGLLRIVSEALGSQAEAVRRFPGLLDADAEVKGTPLRVTFAHHYPQGREQAVYSVLWTGAVSAVGAQWENGWRPVAKVQATDGAAWAAREQLLALGAQSALAAGARWLFPLSGPGGEVVAQWGAVAQGWEDVAGRDDGGPGGGPSVRTADVPVPPLALRRCGVPEDAATFAPAGAPGPGGDADAPEWSGGTATDGWALDTGPRPAGGLPSLGPSAGPGLTLHAMAMPYETGLGRSRTVAALKSPSLAYVVLGLDPEGRPRVIVHDRWAGSTSATAAAPVTSRQWHHLAVTMEESLTTYDVDYTLWVDGVAAASSTHPGGLFEMGARRIVVGADTNLRNPWDGALCNVAGHAEVLSATLLARLAAARDGAAGDDAGRRFARLLWSVGLPQDARAVGSSTMLAQATAGASLASALDVAAAAEQTMWYVHPDGDLRLLSRSQARSAPVSDPVPAAVLDGGLRWDVDDEGRCTVAVVRRPGRPDVVRRAAAWRRLGVYERVETVLVDSQAQAEAVADAWIWGRAAARPRSTELAVDVFACGASVPVTGLLWAGPGSVLAVDGLPEESPGGLGRVQVLGVSDAVSADGWLRTFSVGPAPAGHLSSFRLDSSPLDGSDVLAL